MQPDGKYSSSVNLKSEALIGWTLVLLLCLIPAGIWVSLHNFGSVNSFTGAVFSIGQLAGLVGLVLYSVNLVLTTRLRFLEELFGGLNRVYIAHHIIGGLALLFLTLHPLLLALRFVGTSAYDAVLLLLPNGLGPVNALFNAGAENHTEVLHQWAIFFGIIAFWGMVILLIVTFFIKLPYHLWLFIHKFLGVSFFIAGLHVLFVGSDLSRSPTLKFYLLFMVGIGLVAFVYKTLIGNVVIRKYQYTVESIKTVGGNVNEIYLNPQKQHLQHKPGQFVFVRFPAISKAGREWHPFSISSPPGEDKLRVNIKSLGDYTNKLGELKHGDPAEIEGAYGGFSYTRYKNTNQVWIAGGIGITPFLSMASSLTDNGHDIHLFYCVKTESELIDWQTLVNLNKSNKGFHLHAYVQSRNKSYLSAKVINQTVPLQDREIFICGPPAMMKSLRNQLQKMGIQANNIHTEEFSMS